MGTAAWKLLSSSCSLGLFPWEVTAGEGQGQENPLNSDRGVGHLCTSTKEFNAFCWGQIVVPAVILAPHPPWGCRRASMHRWGGKLAKFQYEKDTEF